MHTELTMAALVGAATMLAGCQGMCLVQICENGVCRCAVSTCPDGASWSMDQNQCVCDQGKISLDGQCLGPAEANAYCGKGFHFENGGCVPTKCGPNEELDLASGGCLPRGQVAAVASSMGVTLGEGQKLGCPAGSRLVVEGQSAACVPESQTCAPDETWDGQRCIKATRCGTGQIFDPGRGGCVAYATGAESNALVVDVRQWATANYGPDGGNGTAKFCGQFARKPWSFGVSEGQRAAIRIAVTLSFPGDSIATGAATTTAQFTVSGAPVPAKGAAAVQEAAASLFATLQRGGGQPNAAAAVTTVQCIVENAAKPIAVPETAGF
jgi:hypothetical protein